ncbi:MAG: hypothetical protein FWE23_09970 [Chitinivibrionia bacterium]|nr:hypothetical protein [Chitinivibrionia bacterium]
MVKERMRPTSLYKEEVFSRENFARSFVASYDQALKMMQGKQPRSKTSFREKLNTWQKLAEEDNDE